MIVTKVGDCKMDLCSNIVSLVGDTKFAKIFCNIKIGDLSKKIGDCKFGGKVGDEFVIISKEVGDFKIGDGD